MALLAALLATGMSSAPGWRDLRWFAIASVLAAMFVLTNTATYLDVPEKVALLGSRVAMFFGGLHTTSWIKFASVQRNTKVSRLDAGIIAIGIVLSTLTLVPGLYMTDVVRARAIPWLGITYRDGVLTPVGTAAFTYHLAALFLVFGRYVIASFRGVKAARTYSVALGVMVLCALHDTFAVEGLARGPYLLDLALLVLVLIVGGSLTRRFVESARELERSTRSLALAQEQLVKRERLAALGELSAVVAHEVRNPLGVVYNALSGLRKTEPGSEDFDELLRMAEEEAGRIRKIISDLLEFARPRPTVFVPVDLADVVRSAVDAARSSAEVSSEDVIVTVAPQLAAFVCDEQLIRQAVINLVTNALQAPARKQAVRVSVGALQAPSTFEADGPSRGSTRLRVAPAVSMAPGVFIRVLDDGAGIPIDLRERVFTPFFSTRATGTGLGLAVVRRAAEAHGGTVEVTEARGGGACFALILPRPN